MKPRALFCFDTTVLLAPDGKVYARPQFSYPYWRRYLEAFGSLTVACRAKPGEGASAFDQAVEAGGKGVSFLDLPNLSSLGGLVRDRAAAGRLLAEAMNAVDLVICRLPSEIGLLGASLARRIGKPYLVELVSCPWDAMRHYGGLKGKLYAPVLALRVRQAVAAAPFVHYDTGAFAQRRYPTKGRWTRLSSVELPPAEPGVLERRVARIRSPRPSTVLGLVGHYDSRIKGVEVTLDALATLQGRMPGLAFRVLGTGNRAALEAKAQARGVRNLEVFAPVPSGDPVFAWLDEIDIYLQPSFCEGLPRSLIEAMSRGCPAIGSTAGGIPELLPAAMLHRPGDAAGLARLIEQLASDRDALEAQARRNFAASRAYDREELRRRQLLFWDEVIRRSGRDRAPPPDQATLRSVESGARRWNASS